MSGSAKTRVLFICIGNACRSQMAEGFARTYGSDVLTAASAGLVPANSIPGDTLRAMDEKNISLHQQYPKSVRQLGKSEFDLIVNLSGRKLPSNRGDRIVVWEVPDPIGFPLARHREVRDSIEQLVMKLVIELRRKAGQIRPPSMRRGS